MAVYLEFVVAGPPVSSQQNTAKGRANLAGWQKELAREAESRWKFAPLTGVLKALIINFHESVKPSVDLDNILKPILDAMQKIILENDRQIRQAEIAHVNIDSAFAIKGVSKLIVDALHVGDDFIFLRIEDPDIPYPLPR